MRLSSIVPQGVQHKSTKDTMLGEYFIPNNTIIVSNLFHIHHDTKIWGEDAETFKPSRFISPDGKFQGHEALIPFSSGYRQCLGEVVAKNAIFLYTTNVFQKFTVEFDEKSEDNGFEPQFSFIMYPKPYNVVFKDISK
jgi:cytochrome P450